MKKNKIILIGYRATGKTTLAALLGKRYSIEAIDTDPLIEQEAGKTISRIFAEDGEPAFRDLEAQVVRKTLARPESLVLATGGGVPLRSSSRILLKESGKVFWLTATAQTIFRRMYGDETTADRRPALTGRSPLEEIEFLLQQRDSAYRDTADVIVSTENRDLSAIADEIASIWETAGGAHE
ncbi:MAG: shikimate kinase [Thermoguttaceae bacterium]|nr:shikimate kinase [Thermoguttaceae bacterium]